MGERFSSTEGQNSWGMAAWQEMAMGQTIRTIEVTMAIHRRAMAMLDGYAYRTDPGRKPKQDDDAGLTAMELWQTPTPPKRPSGLAMPQSRHQSPAIGC